MRKKKFKLIIWPIIYAVLITCVCVSAAMVFHSYYYTAIYVSGSSMEPTLNGEKDGLVDYGIIDTHDYAIDTVIRDSQRFKIITCHYPFNNGGSSDYEGGYVHGGTNKISSNASYKIKRIYAFPGESFKFEAVDGEVKFYVQKGLATSWIGVTPVNITFDRLYNNVYSKMNYEHNEPLGDDEFWVMGDNYNVSFDCYSKKLPIYRDNIVGVLIAIEGRCVIQTKHTSDDEGTHISATCTNRQRYIWPKYF